MELVISEKENLDKILKGSDVWFKTILDSMINGIQVISSDWKYLYVNDALVKQGKYSREELLGKTMMEKYPGIEKTEMFKQMKTVMERQTVEKMENEFVFPDGSKGWFNLVIQPAMDGISIISEDITERKRALDELARLASIPMANPQPVTETDINGQVFFMNAGAQNLLFDLRQKGIEHPWLLGINQMIKDYLEKGIPIKEREVQISDKWYQQSIQYLPEGQRIRIHSVDISSLKLAQERALELNRLKDDFLSVTTHELKTPLIPIKSQSQLLLDGDYGEINPKQKEAVEMILRNEEILNSLSSEVLDIAKIKSKKLILIIEKVDMVELVSEMVANIKNQLVLKNITLSLMPFNGKAEIMGDKIRVKEVVANLLDNAIKFTPENGNIIVELKSVRNEIWVSIKDSGIGISKENIDKLFTPFFQIDSAYSRKYRGTGLGLAVSKGIVEAHGGKIWVESEGNDKGSTFVFTLPIKIINLKI